MNEITQQMDQVLKERFDSLLPEIQSIILDESLEEYMLYALDAARLPESLEPQLENEVVLLLMGFASIDDFPQNIAQALKVESDAANQITSVLFETFFAGLEDYIRLVSTELQKPTEGSGEQNGILLPENLPTEDAATQTQPTATQTPTPAKTPTPILSYKKPLTDLPRYDERRVDPYKESSDDGGEEGGMGAARP